MNTATPSSHSIVIDEVTDDGFAHPLGRKLRSFDVGGISPYEYPGVVEFLKEAKLVDLTADEIRAFLLLRDNPDPRGYTRDSVAGMLDISARKASTCLDQLRRKRYVLHSTVERPDELVDLNVGWVVDRTNPWTDPEVLFWEFGYLMDSHCDCCC